MTKPDDKTDSQAEALRPRFSGGRFDGPAGYPADALSELAAYAKLIEAVATRRHRQQENRKRAERGYADRVRLRLRRVDEGSQIPVLFCPADAVLEVEDAEQEVILQLQGDGVDKEIQRFFRAFGRTLAGEERIELGSSGKERFSYTAATRKRILEETGQTDVDDVDVFGRIVLSSMPEENEPSLTLQIANGGPKVKMRMPLDEIRKALDNGVSDRLLQVRGTGELLPSGVIREIEHVDELRVVDSDLDGARDSLVEQFERLKREGAEAPHRFRTFLEYCIAEGMDARPYVIATDEGIEAEWQIGRTNTTAALRSDWRVYAHVTDLDRKTYREATFPCEYLGAVRLVELWRGDVRD